MKASMKFLVVPLAVGALIFAGCGGSDNSSSDNSSSDANTTQSQPAGSNSADAGKAGTIALAADPSGALAYDTDTLTANAGKVTLDFTNDASIPHDVVIEDSSNKKIAQTDIITGESTSTELTVKPGTYTYYCSLPGHEAAGMKGTLTVK